MHAVSYLQLAEGWPDYLVSFVLQGREGKGKPSIMHKQFKIFLSCPWQAGASRCVLNPKIAYIYVVLFPQQS